MKRSLAAVAVLALGGATGSAAAAYTDTSTIQAINTKTHQLYTCRRQGSTSRPIGRSMRSRLERKCTSLIRIIRAA